MNRERLVGREEVRQPFSRRGPLQASVGHVMPLILSVLTACPGPFRTAPQQAAASGVQAFVRRPAPEYRAPAPEPSPYPTTRAPCGASRLRATPDPGTGAAAGNILYRVVFTNVSRSACLLGPRPAVQGLDATDRLVALPVQEGGTYFADPAPADTAPGGSGFINIGTATAANCPEIPEATFRRLRFGFHDGWLDTDLTITVGCGTLQISGIGKEFPPAPRPTAAAGDPGTLRASFGRLPAVRPGTTMRYTVRLSNPTDVAVSLRPCPSFTQRLDRHSESLYLNCDALERIDPGREVGYAMEVEVPTDLSSGDVVKLSWSLNAPTATVGDGVKVGD